MPTTATTTAYRTIVPNGHGGGTTYRDHIVNPTTREDAYAVAARIPGAWVQVSPNGVTGWEDDAAGDTHAAHAGHDDTPADITTMEVCVDCMQFVAGIDAHERGEDYPAAVVAAMTAPDAAAWTLVNACGEDCADTCTAFSYAPCGTCGSWLAGERHAVAAIAR